MESSSGKSGFHRVITVDDGKLWYRDKRHEMPAHEVSGQGDSARVDNLCESTAEMCTHVVGPKNGADALCQEQDFDTQVANHEKSFKALPIEELDRIIDDIRSTEVQRAAAANLRQKSQIARGLITPDNANY